MRILVVTQTVDIKDPVLGFFHRWLEEFSKHADINVVCLKEGEHMLPPNVRIFSLGKESGVSRVTYLLRFYVRIWKLRRDYDSVFVHMNPEYVLLGGFIWRMLGKRVGIWYVHRSVTLRLRVAAKIVNVVFTASKESFRLNSSRVQVVGHGIDIAQFDNLIHTGDRIQKRIITTGRVSRTKRLNEMIDGLAELYARGVSFDFSIIGAPVMPADFVYQRELKERISTLSFRDKIHFIGPLRHTEIPAHLATATVFLNLSATGSLDKAVLEAGAAGLPVVTSNEAFRHIVPAHLFLGDLSPHTIADAIEKTSSVDGDRMRTYVREHHDLRKLIESIVGTLQV